MAVVRLTRPLSGEAGDEAHDGVVITDGGGGEDEVEVGVGVGLVDVRRAELGLGVPGGEGAAARMDFKAAFQPYFIPLSAFLHFFVSH
jgi:hypothetical protein